MIWKLIVGIVVFVCVNTLEPVRMSAQTTTNTMEQRLTTLEKMVNMLQQQVAACISTPQKEEDMSSESVLRWSASSGETDIVTALLNKGVNINAQDPEGRTALHIAAEKGQVQVINILLAHGADVNIKDNQGQTALNRATEKDQKEAAQILSNYAKISGMAGKESEPAKMNVATPQPTEQPLQPSQPTLNPNADLLRAAAEGNATLLKTILAQGADVNAATDQGYTALMLAVSGGFGSMIMDLLDKGAEVNRVTAKGYTALIMAVAEERTPIVQALLQHGADIKQKTGAGSTALDLAKERKNKEIIRLLENAEVSVGPNQFKVSVKRPYASGGGSQDISPLWKDKAREICGSRTYNVLSYEYIHPGSDQEEIVGVIECEK